ncbi:MAG: DoxX family membrane protein [Phycisphaeraceae bacterium]|nr:DoxX family membrane protein [Phycisphaeraceae bacterium]
MKRLLRAGWWWLLLCRTTVAAFFGLAAYSKLVPPNASQRFLEGVKAFKILPDHLVIAAANTIPWAEAICALLLLLGAWTRAAALVIAALLGSFLYGLLTVINRADGSVSECSCFGDFIKICDGPPGTCHLVLDGALLCLALVVLLFGPGRLSVDHLCASRKPPEGVDYVREVVRQEGRPI